VIATYGTEATRDIHERKNSKAARSIPQDVWPIARRKLDMIHYARAIGDLVTPGNNLEKLKGELKGYYSIRINDQWRVVFKFRDNGTAEEVTIKDYH
jgi:proteic killer suppression protein